MDLPTQITTYATAAIVLAQGIAYVWRKRSDTEAKRSDTAAKAEDWLRKKIDEQLKARDRERTDCTEKIQRVEKRLDEREAECQEKIESLRGRLEEMIDARAGDISARHEMARQLRQLRERVDSMPPPVSAILRTERAKT